MRAQMASWRQHPTRSKHPALGRRVPTRRTLRRTLLQAPMFIFRPTKFAAIYTLGNVLSLCRWAAPGCSGGCSWGLQLPAGGRGLSRAPALIHFNRVWPLDPCFMCSTMFLMVSEQGGWVVGGMDRVHACR